MRVKYYTLWICALIVFVFFVLQSALGLDLAWEVGSLHPNFFFSMVAHGSTSHLLGNLFALFLFGLILEGTLGSDRYVLLLFAAAVAGNLAGIGSYDRVLGISGGILGVIGALAVLRPTMVVWISGLPMPMLLAGVAYAAIDLLGAIAPASNTGHLAHLGGLVVGVALGWWFRDVADTGDDGFGGSRRSRLGRREKRRIDNRLDEYEQRYLR